MDSFRILAPSCISLLATRANTKPGRGNNKTEGIKPPYYLMLLNILSDYMLCDLQPRFQLGCRCNIAALVEIYPESIMSTGKVM